MTATPQHSNALGRAILGFIQNRPKSSLFLSAVFIALSLPGLTMLPVDLTHRAMLDDDHPLLVELDQLERRFGNDDSVVIAIHSPSGVFDAETITLLHELTDAMWYVTDVIRVDSLTNFNLVRAEGDELIVEALLPRNAALTEEFLTEREQNALNHDTLPGYLIDKSGHTAVIFAAIRPGFETPPPEINIVLDVRKLMTQFEGRGDHTFHVVGNPANAVAFQDSMVGDLQLLVPLVSLLTLFLLYALLRSIAGVVLPIAVVVIAVVTTMGIAGWLGVVITNLTSILPQILLAIGIAASVHILVTFLREMDYGRSQQEAAVYSLSKNLIPTFLTSISTSIGFASFSTATVNVIGYLGVMGAIGTMVTWLAAYFILGPLLFLVPIKRTAKPAEKITRRNKWIESTTRWMFHKRVPIIVTSCVVSVGSIYLGLSNEVNSDPLTYLAESVPLRQSVKWFEGNVGGVRNVELSIDSGNPDGIKDPEFLQAAEKLQQWLLDKPYVTQTVSIINVIKQMNRSLHGDDQAYYRLPESREMIGQELFLYTMSLPQGMDVNNLISSKSDQIRMTILWTLNDSAEMLKVGDEIAAKAEELDLDVTLAGKQWMFQALNPLVVQSFIVSICAAIVLISFLLVLVFRSLKLGLLAMAPNMVPLFFGAAALYVMGQPMDMGTTLVFAVCLGIAVDDTIHILANFNRHMQTGTTTIEAVEKVFAETAPALITTTAILVTAFGVFAFATFTPNLYFGLLTAIILSVALITDLTFLPSILFYQGRTGEED